jgi:hypothetical protein
MQKKKDNLTDVVEQLPKVETSDESNSPKDQQVIDSDGDIITLGNKPKKNVRLIIKGKSFELTESELEKMVKTIFEKELDKFADKVMEAFKKKLKDKGFL